MKKNFFLPCIIMIIILAFSGCNPGIQDQESQNSQQSNMAVLDDSQSDCKVIDKVKTPKVTMSIGTAFAAGHILNDYCLKFKELAEAKTHGKLLVNVVTGETEESYNIKCSTGEVDMQATGGYPLQVFAPQYFFFNAPYVIKDYDHYLRVWNGPLGAEAKALIKTNGNMIDAGSVYRGLRQMTSNKPITGTADLIGLKLRLPTVPVWVTIWSALETAPVTVPLTGLYDALATGTAEASEGDLAQINSYKLYEVQSNITLTNHLVAIGWIMINEDFFNSLPRRYKKVILKASKEACDFATAKLKASEADILASLQANGMVVGTPDAEAIRVKAKPSIENLFLTQWPVTTWENVLAQ